MDHIRKAIEDGLQRQGRSASAVSMDAVGNPSAIKNLLHRRGSERAHPIENLLAVAKVLGLELYLGPPRATQVEAHVELDGEDYAGIPLQEAEVSAGPGMAPDDVIERQVVFRCDWLRKLGVNPADARLVRVRGDSMEPIIRTGDMVMIDTTKREPRQPFNPNRPEMFVLRDVNDDLRLKWIEWSSPDLLVLHSENVAQYRPEAIRGTLINTLGIIGQVVWWGHTEW